MMGTLVDFTLYSDNKKNAPIAIKAASDEMQRIEQLFSIYGDQPNAIKTFNTSVPNTPIKLPDEVDTLLAQAEQLRRKSLGAFNPALGSLNKLWGFSRSTDASLPAPSSPPATDQISALQAASMHCIQKHHQNRWSRKNRDCKLDFGAIAKGYALEQGMQVLKSHGIQNAIINAGGDIRVSGKHGGRAWKIGIRHPRHAEKVIATINIEGDLSIVTSGDYERFYIYKGKRYHHILDPKTGMPATKTQSATVVTTNATSADAWSTALFVTGLKGIESIEKLGMSAILIDADGKIHTTENIESRLQLSFSPPMLRTSEH